VVLLDIGMPHLDGYDTCRRLRAAPRGAELVILALTGWGQEDVKARAREAGFDHHLVKPVASVVLQNVLASVLSSRAGS
jgi:CheY-like chemotaxis protein